MKLISISQKLGIRAMENTFLGNKFFTITIVDALKLYLVMDIYEIYFIKGGTRISKKNIAII